MEDKPRELYIPLTFWAYIHVYPYYCTCGRSKYIVKPPGLFETTETPELLRFSTHHTEMPRLAIKYTEEWHKLN